MSVIASLWLPIVLSAVALFVLSAASHMALPWRRKEWARITDFAALQAALQALPPGQYAFPAAPEPREQMKPEWLERWARGPSGWLTIAPRRPINMARNMGLSFLVFLAVAFMAAYTAGHSLGPTARGLSVFRIVGTVGTLSFGVGTIFSSIWYDRPWRNYLADAVDAVLFGLVMAGIFAWLWPG
jgi:hypothetical protein